MTEKKSPYCGCLLYTANALSRVITKMAEEEFAVVGVAPSHCFLLMTVHNDPGIQASGIAEKMMLTPSTVTRLVEKMEQQRYVQRITDGKYTLVYPTKKTNDVYPAILESWQNLFRRYAEVLGEEVARQLTAEIYSAALKLEAR
ncbi:MAG: MarR family transcriptional regulator [Lewinellaceae bacterium]|nr:MarR family transcriptional regulator [Lewinellaceae bacterium]